MDLPTFDKVRERFLQRTNFVTGDGIQSLIPTHREEEKEDLSDMHIGKKLCTNDDLGDEGLVSFIETSLDASGETWSSHWGYKITEAVSTCRKLANNAEKYCSDDSSTTKRLRRTCEFVNGLSRLNVDVYMFLSDATATLPVGLKRHPEDPIWMDMFAFNFDSRAVRGGCDRNRNTLDLYSYLTSKSGFGYTCKGLGKERSDRDNSPFPWPMVEMAEFNRVTSDSLRNHRNVLVIVGLPKDYDSTGVLALQKFLAEALFRNVVPRVHIQKLYLPRDSRTGFMRGSVFIEFASEKQAETARRSVDGMLWPIGGNFAGIRYDLQQILSLPQRLEVPEEVEPPQYGHWMARQFHHFKRDVEASTYKESAAKNTESKSDESQALEALLWGSPQHSRSKSKSKSKSKSSRKEPHSVERESKRKASKCRSNANVLEREEFEALTTEVEDFVERFHASIHRTEGGEMVAIGTVHDPLADIDVNTPERNVWRSLRREMEMVKMVFSKERKDRVSIRQIMDQLKAKIEVGINHFDAVPEKNSSMFKDPQRFARLIRIKVALGAIKDVMAGEAREDANYRRQAELAIKEHQLDNAKVDLDKANVLIQKLQSENMRVMADNQDIEATLQEREEELNTAHERVESLKGDLDRANTRISLNNTCMKLTKTLLEKNLNQWLEDASASLQDGSASARREEERDSDSGAALAECEANIQGVLAKIRAARAEWGKRSAMRKVERENRLKLQYSGEGEREARSGRLCTICMEREKCTLLLPCRHLCVCAECYDNRAVHGKALQVCPMCRTHIEDTLYVYS